MIRNGMKCREGLSAHHFLIVQSIFLGLSKMVRCTDNKERNKVLGRIAKDSKFTTFRV